MSYLTYIHNFARKDMCEKYLAQDEFRIELDDFKNVT